MKRYTLALASGAAVLLLSACGSPQSNSNSQNQAEPTRPAATPKPVEAAPTKPAAAPTQPPAAPKPTEAAKPAAGETVNVGALDQNLDTLKSYKLNWSMAWEGKDEKGAPQAGSMAWLQEYINASKDQHLKMTTKTDEKPAGESVEWFQVGDAFYIYSSDKTATERCFGMSSNDTKNKTSALNPNSILGALNNLKLVKRGDTVNGIVADQYQIVDQVAGLGLSAAVAGSVWLARDGGYVAKYTSITKGANLGIFSTAKGEGTLTVTYDVTEVNKINAIAVPADCAKPGTGLPVPKNATDQASMGPMTTFKVTDPPKTIADFYKKELAALGYKMTSEDAYGDIFSLAFSKDAAIVNIMITKESDATTVLITEAK